MDSIEILIEPMYFTYNQAKNVSSSSKLKLFQIFGMSISILMVTLKSRENNDIINSDYVTYPTVIGV